MMLQASSLQLYCKKDSGTDVLKNSSGRLLLTLQVHKVDKNVSRYCNKDIKVISVEAVLVTLYQLWKWYCMVKKLWKPPSRKNFRNLQGKYLWRRFVITIRQTIFLRFTVIFLWFWSLWSYETLFGNFTFRVQSSNGKRAFLWKSY